MLWVALYCPTLPLDRIQRRLPDALALPVAVSEAKGNKRWIALANPAASATGIATGQPVATALALCPHVLLLERDAEDERQALNEAALACLRYTPSTRVCEHGLLLEISASVRLFGGRRALLNKILQSLRDLELNPSIGVAPSAHGAWLLAQSVKPLEAAIASRSQLAARLDGLPIGFLESTGDHLQTLIGIGCRHLGDIRRLPRAGLARRFGAALLDEIDRAYARSIEPCQWFEAPLRFEARLELIARVESAEALIFAARRLMTQLAGWLGARQAAVGQLTLTLHHERWRTSDRPLTQVVIRLAEPSRDPEHLLGLIRERLGQLTLDSPVEELSLSADDVTQADPANHELFPTVQSHSVSLNRLIEKLSARLGADAITRVHAKSDHRPEKCWGTRPATDSLAIAPETPLVARPAWLVKEPEALRLEGHRPFYGSPLVMLCGPERIESGWWDDGLIERDYFIAENDARQLLWVYRERRATDVAAQWFLHGFFA